MFSQVVNLTFVGHWGVRALEIIPSVAGIYCAHTGLALPNGQVALERLLYVGQAKNMRGRVSGHEKWPLWARYVTAGRAVWINAALVADDSLRDQVEAALIFHHKPPTNDNLVDAFNYPTTTVRTFGQNGLLAGEFTIQSSPVYHALLRALSGSYR